jgi:BAAT / Acyl-CoA thioester hydrolase C terminal
MPPYRKGTACGRRAAVADRRQSRRATVPQGIVNIPVRRIDGPVLVAGAGDDSVWDSQGAVERIRQEPDHGRFGLWHRELDFPRAGHSIGLAIPYLPETDDLGGTLRVNAGARTQVWAAILDLLRRLSPPH